MTQLQTKPFPFYVGVYSLEELVNKDSRVCVINILGGESRKVTPVSHEYSNGNVVAGVQYGRRGELESKKGNIPVFRSIRDVMDNGITFDVGVIYLPPTAVSQAVAELVNFNPDLKRIVIVTEKVSSYDSMAIRVLCQEAGVDVIGCNCLGVANVWDHVRVGGALGGDRPEETLRPGSVAIHSNSGNFTTTISEYLRTSGFGISTAVSSGKDVYIHFALPEFLFAAQNDPRTKAIALYVEPGGYYEKQALEWIEERRFAFNKPIVVCVTGRWKKDLQRSCGHAGALAGGGDDAISKEQWFDDYFGVGVFDPENPNVSKKGVRIASIQDFPKAMQAVYAKIDEKPDFETTGDLSLKLWISDNKVKVPKELDLPVTEAIEPYNKQILEQNKQIGANYLRQNMSDKSGASRMDKNTQVAHLHGKSILDLSKYSIEENLYFTLAKVLPEQEDTNTINILLNLFLKVEAHQIANLQYAKNNNCTPNAFMASQISAIGNKALLDNANKYSTMLVDVIRENGIEDNTKDLDKILNAFIDENILTDEKSDNETADILEKEVLKSKKKCISLKVVQHILKYAADKKKGIKNKYAFLLAGMSLCIFWKPMQEKRITRDLAENALSYFYTVAQLVAFAVTDIDNNKYWKELTSGKVKNINNSFSDNVFKILFNREPKTEELTELKYLIGLTLTNGPGTISAKGAKETVSARNYIPTSYVGFLVNTGLAHGGNGFEAVEFLLRNFKDSELKNPGDKAHNIDLTAIANKAAKEYRNFKKMAKEGGKMNYAKIPCVNHPVFKGNDVNIDPREDFVRKELESSNIYNIFLDFYHKLVVELFNEGATRNVFCVNVDAVISVIALKLVWNDLQAGTIDTKQVQDLVFILFLIGRAVGVSAEIADHRDRGQDMDCRTPQSKLGFVM